VVELLSGAGSALKFAQASHALRTATGYQSYLPLRSGRPCPSPVRGKRDSERDEPLPSYIHHARRTNHATTKYARPAIPDAIRSKAWSLDRLAGRSQACIKPLPSSDVAMVTVRRRAAPSGDVQALSDTNSALKDDNARLEGDNANLKAERDRLRQRIKSLEVAVITLLASSAGLSVGMATSMAGVAAETALAIATSVSFGVIMAAMAILTYMRR
jgi:hypothetical protein